MPTFQMENLKTLCSNILKKVGATEEESLIVADNLVKANLRGIDSHGVRLLPAYIERVKAALIKTNASIQVVKERPSTALMDGDSGFGQVVGVKAMELAVNKAKNQGTATVGAFNTNHFGFAAYYSMIALDHDMIGIAMTNGAPTMAPWGGKASIMGNNPISYSIPAGEEKPIVVDIAMSVVARAKVTLAIDEGKPLPEGWALDKMGQPTTDPEAALEGVLLPIGGYKGYGLALAIDVLTGAITGAGCSDEVRRSTDLTGPSMIAHQMMAIDIESFMDISSFKRKIDELIRKVKTSPSASGTEEIFIPGEIEFRKEEKRLSEGISIDEKSWMKIEEIAKELQLEL